MYKRTTEAIVKSIPENSKNGAYMVKAQFGIAHWEKDIAFCITSEVDSTGCYALVEIQNET